MSNALKHISQNEYQGYFKDKVVYTEEKTKTFYEKKLKPL